MSDSTMVKQCDECNHTQSIENTVCEECGCEVLRELEACTYLECDHCGDVAVESLDGTFSEDMADSCSSCCIAGHVSIDQDGSAVWYSHSDQDAVFCSDENCDECNMAARSQAEFWYERAQFLEAELKAIAGNAANSRCGGCAVNQFKGYWILTDEQKERAKKALDGDKRG